jgi:hypothetical protein
MNPIESWKWYAAECWMFAEEPTPIGWIKYILAELLDSFHRRVTCRLFDHKLIDAGSYANPDSGAEHLECTRCGWTFYHTYY